jgi:rod shape-determining protein MreC
VALNRFWRQNRRLFFVLVLFAAPLVPLMLMKTPLPRINVMEHVQSWLVHPLTSLTRDLAGGSGIVLDRYLLLVGAKKENEELRLEVERLRARLLEMEEKGRENERLTGLLSLTPLPSHRAVAARVIGEDTSLESFGFWINLGSKDGVRVRLPVVAENGVVGSVARVFPGSSLVVAVFDPSHDVDGTILRSRAKFIVEGRGPRLTGRLKYLDRSEDVRVGDEVLTSGLDGVFPKGLRIGTIIEVNRPRMGVLQDAELRPEVDFGKLEELQVLIPLSDSSGAG